MPPIEANQQDYRVIEKSELSLTCRQNCLLSAASFSFTNSTMNLQPRPIEPLPPPPRPGLHISPREEELGRKLKEMLDTLTLKEKAQDNGRIAQSFKIEPMQVVGSQLGTICRVMLSSIALFLHVR